MKTRAQKKIEEFKDRIRESVARHGSADLIAASILSGAGLEVASQYNFARAMSMGIIAGARGIVSGCIYQLLSDQDVFMEMERCAKPRTCAEIAKFFAPENTEPYSESIVWDAVNWFVETHLELFDANARYAARVIEQESIFNSCAKPSQEAKKSIKSL